MTVDIIIYATTLSALALASFVAGWRAHRWHVLSFSRWPKRPSTKAPQRRSYVLTRIQRR